MDSNPTNENKETDPQMPTAPEGCKNSNIQEESKKESSSESAITQKNETKQNDETEKIEKNIKPNQDSNTTIKNADDDLDKRASHLSHASRRVILNNVYKWSRNNDVEKLIQSIVSTLPEENTVKVAKFKKPPKKDWVSITFETDSMAEAFTEAVKNGKFEKQKGNRKHLFAKVSSDQDDRRDSSDKNNRGNKRGRNENDNSLNEANGGKRGKIESNDEPLDDDGIRDSMTPLWRKPYEDQLKWKWRQMVNKCTKKIAQDLKTTFRNREKEAKRNKNVKLYPMYKWITANKAIKVLPILPSPQTTEYRNKIELTFGYTNVNTSDESTPETKTTLEESPTPMIIDGKDGSNNPPTKIDHQTKKVPIVGFTTKGWSGPLSHPHPCQNVPREACGIANIVNEFLSTSPIPPYNSRVHRGIWRILTMRFSRRTKECMLIFLHAPPSGGAGKRETGEDNYTEHWESEKQRLVKMLTEGNVPMPEPTFPDVTHKEPDLEGPASFLIGKLPPTSTLVTGQGINTSEKNESFQLEGMKVTSIYFQEYDGLSNPRPEHPVQHVYGSLAMKERLGQCHFQISPGAFFQVNTEGAEVLYNIAVQSVKEITCAGGAKPENTLLFDVCCGTGTIGLTCMKEGAVGKVIGVDISEPAIRDAIVNAELNGYKHKPKHNGDTDEDKDIETKNTSSNTKFIASRAELVLANELRAVKDDDDMVIAVVDPAREGLHNDVIKALRSNEGIQRLVYVSCNPSGTLVKDASMLCGPPTKKYPGTPFKPTFAQPVDMFPLTNHCEMVMVFDRMSKEESTEEKKDEKTVMKDTKIEPQAEIKIVNEEKDDGTKE